MKNVEWFDNVKNKLLFYFNYFVGPLKMECPSSPSREMSRLQYESRSNEILQQEKFHAASKKPRRTRFVLEADSRIQNIATSVVKIKKRVLAIQTDFKNLAMKVNRLDVIKEQACFFMSPKRVLGSAFNRSPMKLTYFNPAAEYISDFSYISPTQGKLVEFMRRRKLVSIHAGKMFDRIDNERKVLEEIFENNINLLRYKRAEKCLIKMITLQSRIKILGRELVGLEERLLADDSFDGDSIYNVSHGRSNWKTDLWV